MIYKNRLELQARYYGGRAIGYIYKGAQLIWQRINSCFGNGYWVNTIQWKNEEAWKN